MRVQVAHPADHAVIATLPFREPLDAEHPDEIPAGHVLGEPGILFAKIPDEVVAEERARLGATA